MKYYIIFGPPGAGKGTHGVVLAEELNLRHISTGELLRAEMAAGTPLGNEASMLIANGNLVPDKVVEGMIKEAFENNSGIEGFLLDGFPRTLAQAKDLDAILAERGEEVTAIIGLMVSEQTIRDRITKRAAIEGRADDADDEIISNRIRTYHEQTEPIIEYYSAAGKYHEIDVDHGDIAENRRRVMDLARKL